MKILSLVSDAFGGRGGIALYNRNLLQAICAHPKRPEVVAIPRLVPDPLQELPSNLDFRSSTHGSKARFALETIRSIATHRPLDLIVLSHIHLLPFAVAAKQLGSAKIVLFTYGIDAWNNNSTLVSRLVHHIDRVVSIRQHTIDQFLSWSQLDCPTQVLENAIHLSDYGIKDRRKDLVEKYGLDGKRVLMTLGRIEDPRFGFDEIIRVLPALAQRFDNLCYLVVGSGGEVPRLKKKAAELGVGERVVFAGQVTNEDKADHYRLADAFAMPGSHPSLYDRYPLRFVFLEAMACGLPVVASRPPELSNLADSPIPNIYVDPNDDADLIRGLSKALEQGVGPVPCELQHYDFKNFTHRVRDLVDAATAPS